MNHRQACAVLSRGPVNEGGTNADRCASGYKDFHQHASGGMCHPAQGPHQVRREISRARLSCASCCERPQIGDRLAVATWFAAQHADRLLASMSVFDLASCQVSSAANPPH